MTESDTFGSNLTESCLRSHLVETNVLEAVVLECEQLITFMLIWQCVGFEYYNPGDKKDHIIVSMWHHSAIT